MGRIRRTGWIAAWALLLLLTVFPCQAEAKKKAGGKTRYDKVFFLGDSRMVQLSDLVANDNTVYTARSGAGVYWMRAHGYPQMRRKIKKEKGKKAVVFFMGINDTFHADLYISSINSYYKELKRMGCDVYYLSQTPTTPNPRTPSKSTESVRQFNARVKQKLKKGIRYLDVFQYYRSGINSVDGVHYTDSSYGSMHVYFQREMAKYGAKVRRGKYNWKYKDGSWYCYNKKGRLYRRRFLPLASGKCYVNGQGKKQANRTFTVRGKRYQADRFGILKRA